MDERIAAIATAPGRALRGMVRISGPEVLSCLHHCFTPDDGRIQLEHVTSATSIAGKLTLDGFHSSVACRLYFWPKNRSYTRSPLAELHTIGSPPILAATLKALCVAGARVALPGEFTLRAFLAGRINLIQAEAVLGVIDAQDQRHLDVALEQLSGGLAQPLNQLRDLLLDLLAELEAGLDFADQDIQFISNQELETKLDKAAKAVARIEMQMDQRTEVTDGLRVVLVGWPNVGKSSLFNELAGVAGADALVSANAGTTRDYLTATLDLDGMTCQLIDTAGTQNQRPTDKTGAAAQEASILQHRRANLLLFCIDCTRRLNEWEKTQLEAGSPQDQLLVLTKTDKPRSTDLNLSAVETSSKNGEGIELLREKIRAALIQCGTLECPVVAGTATRCYESLRMADECLTRASDLANQPGHEELIAAEVRTALGELGKVVGTVYTEDVLERIFSRFCIGK